MKIYISGPITGVPDYKERFAEAEERLTKLGHIAINPAIETEGLRPGDYMGINLARMDAADAVYFLDGWRNSSECIYERSCAIYKGKRIYFDLEHIPYFGTEADNASEDKEFPMEDKEE